ncbi:MAG: hypothetical protein JRN26_08065 [Nitrososphaerota archaeon]|jgi:tRNA (guanine26-N2/guanine27-N2)-dimethyltransferase|nr:hypothetical protein [Nitrososphaerota archaeon]MDG6927960.1 hypothetical protein [Nitrososphaerota archaeon]MDG6929629.1 hypothetical protein [Nitrososphaerota archaeon]MDG6932862.1 hypothetical protein [Nitrososphaerota archaeon]MDG6936815.1 hypothetical protein [Nitrososphaerota archaeon]
MGTVEGDTRIYPDSENVFYNPRGKFVRDVFVILFTAYAERIGKNDLKFAEPFSATGIKGMRLAKEGHGFSNFILNDIDSSAVKSILRGVEENNLGGFEVYNLDVFSFLDKLKTLGRVDALDVDPFGSAAPYIQPSLRSVKDGGIVAFTFTDTPVLGTVHNDAMVKRYHIKSNKVYFLKELQARIAASFVISEGSAINLAAVPVFAHVFEHYVRVYFQVRASPSLSLELMEQFGFVYSSECGYASLENTAVCPYCGGHISTSGPVYTGNLFSKELIQAALKNSAMCKPCNKLFQTALQEIVLPYYYELSSLAKVLKKQVPSALKIVDILKGFGYESSPTSFSYSGVKSRAPVSVVKSTFYL